MINCIIVSLHLFADMPWQMAISNFWRRLAEQIIKKICVWLLNWAKKFEVSFKKNALSLTQVMGLIPLFVLNLGFTSRGIWACEGNPTEANQTSPKPFNWFSSSEECLKFVFKFENRLPWAFTRLLPTQMDHWNRKLTIICGYDLASIYLQVSEQINSLTFWLWSLGKFTFDSSANRFDLNRFFRLCTLHVKQWFSRILQEW